MKNETSSTPSNLIIVLLLCFYWNSPLHKKLTIHRSQANCQPYKKSFYLTSKGQNDKVNNYLIKKFPNGTYQFEGHDENFSSLDELIEDCVKNQMRMPFSINRRITPYSVGANRLQVIRASVADHIAFTPYRHGLRLFSSE